MNNLLMSYCGLTDARMRASEKDLPVCIRKSIYNMKEPENWGNWKKG